MDNGSKADLNKVMSIMNLLIENQGSMLAFNSNNINAISLAYECENKEYFRFFIEKCEAFNLFDNLAIKKLVYTMVTLKDWSNLRLLIAKSLHQEQDNKFILNLAYKVLGNGDINLCKSILSTCVERNILFKKGETFLTSILKDFPNDVAVDLINSRLFDLKIPNDHNETPIQIAKNKNIQIEKHILTEESKSGTSTVNSHVKQQERIEPIYESCEIPESVKVFREIALNSKVKYYMQVSKAVIDVYGKVVWTGRDQRKNYYFGIELDKIHSSATNGTFSGQQLFQCEANRGLLAPIHLVTVDNRILEKEKEKTSVSQVSSKNVSALSFSTQKDFGKGIQGNTSTGFLDSLLFGLFAKSDVLDYLFRDETNKDDISQKLKNTLAYEVVFPLREYGYVSYDKIEKLKNIIKTYGPKYEQMIQQESNIENSIIILSKICPNEELLSFITYNNNKTNSMFVQLFVHLTETIQHITSEEMFNFSMVSNEIMFTTLPTCLIMYVPEHHHEEMSCINFIPLKTIDISQVSLLHHKMCISCQQDAMFQCKRCIEKFRFNIKEGFYCHEHKCSHKELVNLPTFTVASKSMSELYLKAVICTDNQKYVAFVNENNFSNRWLRFVNMSANEKDGYSYPKVTVSEDLTKFYQQSNQDLISEYMNYSHSDIRLILKRATVLIYFNSTMSCF